MIIAHDLGTTGNKASLHDRDGRLRHAVTVAYDTHYAAGGIAEQDPHEWYRAVAEATRQLVQAAGVSPTEITTVAMSGQMMAAVLLDERYDVVRPALIWADTRASAQASRLSEQISDADAFALLGHRLNATYTVEKVMWVRDHEPQNFARVAHVCVAKDYVTHRLTGRLVTDRSDASGTNAYDQRTDRWSPEVLAAAGLDVDLFPEIVESTAIAGTLLPDAAQALGLPSSVSVVVGGGDGPIAAVGAGVTSPESGAYVYLGSSSWISLATTSPLADPLRQAMTFNHVVSGLFTPTATMVAGAGSLEWVAEVLEPVRSPGRVARLLEGVDDATASGEGLFFLPHLLGERSPYWNPDAAGAFVGLGRQHTRAQLVRAVLEGVAFNLLTNLNAFRGSGNDIAQVDAIGGGAASDTWLQVLADVWQVPVRRRSIVEEANSLGAAVTGAVAMGYVDWSAAAGLSDVTAEFHPRDGVDWAERHATFLAAYQALEPWFARRMPPSPR